ncbi:hypothetical protein quinque_014009 [Culex quinquefasciatus]
MARVLGFEVVAKELVKEQLELEMQLPLPNPAAAALAKRGCKKNSRNGGCFSNFLNVAAPEFVMKIKVNAGTEKQIGVTVKSLRLSTR